MTPGNPFTREIYIRLTEDLEGFTYTVKLGGVALRSHVVRVFDPGKGLPDTSGLVVRRSEQEDQGEKP
jgi:hypothetical protein